MYNCVTDADAAEIREIFAGTLDPAVSGLGAIRAVDLPGIEVSIITLAFSGPGGTHLGAVPEINFSACPRAFIGRMYLQTSGRIKAIA